MARAQKPTDTDQEQEAPEAPAPEVTTPASARPTLEAVAAELQADPETIRDLYAAEASAQADQCHVSPWSEWLTTALIRRVQVAVEHGPRRGSSDPQVRALEADHSKRVPVIPAVPND